MDMAGVIWVTFTKRALLKPIKTQTDVVIQHRRTQLISREKKRKEMRRKKKQASATSKIYWPSVCVLAFDPCLFR